LYIFDVSLALEREISHPWMGAVHGILVEDDAIWVTCTAADLLLKVAWDGAVLDTWCWREDAELIHALGLPSVIPFDDSIDYRIPSLGIAVHDIGHMNGVSRADGALIVSLGHVLSRQQIRHERAKSHLARFARGAIGAAPVAALRGRRQLRQAAQPVPAPAKQGSFAVIKLTGDAESLRNNARARVLFVEEDTQVPNHDPLEVHDLLVYNDSNRSRLVAYDRIDGDLVHTVRVPGNPGFARGLAVMGNGLFVVGSQEPAAVHLTSLADGRILSSVSLGGRPGETVFGITALPAAFCASRPA
jgi:hypothetical protein